jgi:glutathione synthase/RimK-type ligase-like ATP-grasp enzyme
MQRADDDHAVVVLTNVRDLAADDVIRRLDAIGVEVKRINADECAMSPVQSWVLDDDAVSPGAVWWRQFELPAEPPRFDSTEELLLVRAQWRAWLTTLSHRATPWINDLWAARMAEDKVHQLRTARSVGLPVPRTLITNDRAEAREFGRERSAVVKTLAGAYFETSRMGFVYTNPLSVALESDDGSWHAQPLVVQEQVSGAPVRVVVVGEDCFGARCRTRSLDWRTAGTEAVWEPWDVPPQLAERCQRYLSAMALRYAAFDFVQGGGSTWFLEANQAGEWVFLDRPLNLGIADAIVRLLAGLAARHA